MRLYYWFEKHKIIDFSQAGFRKGSRTEDPLFRFVQSSIDGFQRGKALQLSSLICSRYMIRVWRKGLLMKMSNIGIHGKMLRWIQAFLTNRTIETTV